MRVPEELHGLVGADRDGERLEGEVELAPLDELEQLVLVRRLAEDDLDARIRLREPPQERGEDPHADALERADPQPARIAGLVMGVWFLATSVGNFIGGRVAGFYESFALPSLFGAVAAFAIAAGLLLALVARPITRLADSRLPQRPAA